MAPVFVDSGPCPILSLTRWSRLAPSVDNPRRSSARTPEEETIIPTFETQKLARTYILDIPAPRGQITDRNGVPLAQNKLSYNLAINFPTPLDFSDAQAIQFAREKIEQARQIAWTPNQHLRRRDSAALSKSRHFAVGDRAEPQRYRNTRKSRRYAKAEMVVRPIYVRVYPNGKVAGQIIGYTGKTGRNLDGIIDNHETLWPETEGREGLEQTFNELLTGKHGEYKLTFDKDGRKTSDKLITPPVPGDNVSPRSICVFRNWPRKRWQAKRNAARIVIIDPNNGDILAMASWPTYDPNVFVPSISAEKFKALQDDPNIPLLPRAFRSSYPPGSTFKIAVGIAALESGAVRPEDLYQCVPAIDIGNITFHNWKKDDRGAMNFVQALTESCDTWFYQVGIKTGAEPIIDWALKLGFGAKCGIPLRGEVGGSRAERSVHESDARAQIAQRRHRESIDRPGRHAGHSAADGAGDGHRREWRHVFSNATGATGPDVGQRDRHCLSSARETDPRCFTGNDGPDANGHDRRRERRGRHRATKPAWIMSKSPAKPAPPNGARRTRSAPPHGLPDFFRPTIPQYAFAALYEGDVGSKVHGGTVAAPMIADIFKDVYKEAK